MLPVLILGGLIIFIVENWSPSVPLVIFGAKTIALPLSLWVITACLAGALTTVAIALCLRLLVQTSYRSSSDDGRPLNSSPRPPRPEDKRTQTPKSSRSRSARVDATQAATPEQSKQEPAVDGGMEDWEEFSRPREEWEDWQRSTPIVTEVDVDQPATPGSRFETPAQERSSRSSDSSYSRDSRNGEPFIANDYGEGGDRTVHRDRDDRYRQEAYGQDRYRRDAYEQNPYERRGDAVPEHEQRGRDRNDYARDGYERDDYARDGYERNDYAEAHRPDDYARESYGSESYAQEQYGYATRRRDDYADGDYGGDRDDPDRYGRYDTERYEYGTPYPEAENPPGAEYGPRRGYDQGYGPSSSASEPSEQYIMDYGDEAALDAFDAELDAELGARGKNKTKEKAHAGDSRTGRYRWKNPFNSQRRRDDDPQQDDDLDLSILDDWEE